MEKMTRTQKNILFLLLLSLACLCLMFVVIVSPTPAPEATPHPAIPTVPPVPTPLKHREFMAQIKCERFIKDRLVSPSSAEFSNAETYKINDEPLNYHAVTGIVESQNRMGVWLRSGYRCDVHYLPGQPMTWVLDYLNIDD
jgi:hypothetical protein